MRFSFLIVFSCLVYFLNAQGLHYNKYADIKLDFDTIYDINKKRRNTLLISEVSAYTIALVGLNKLSDIYSS